MAVGLRIRDAAGNIILDQSSRVYKTLKVQTINEGTNTTVVIPDLGTSNIIAIDNTTDEDVGAPVVSAIGAGTVDITWVGGVGGTSPREISIISV